MAYVKKNRTIRLRWDGDHPMAGLEVVARSVPLGKLLFDMGPMLGMLTSLDTASMTVDILAQAKEPFQALADAIISWNIEVEDDDGNRTPVPADLDGLLSLDMSELQEILTQWMEAVGGVSGPLGNASAGTPLNAQPGMPPGIEETLQVDPL